MATNNVKAVIAINLQTGERMQFESQRAASKVLNVSSSYISLICTGKKRSANGYTFETVEKNPKTLTQHEAELIVTMADCDLNQKRTGNKLYVGHTTIFYHIESIKNKTGKDPRKFYDMCELLPVAKAILEEKQC